MNMWKIKLIINNIVIIVLLNIICFVHLAYGDDHHHNNNILEYNAKLLDDRTSEDQGEYLTARPVNTLTIDNKLHLKFDIEPPKEMKNKFSLKQSTLTKAKLIFNIEKIHG